MTAFGRRIRAGSAQRGIIIRLILILLIISASLVWLLRSPTFKISQINISWDEPKFLLPEVETRLRNFLGSQLIFLVSPKKVLSQLGDFPVIQDVQITKTYPSTVGINLTTRKPSLVLIQLASGQDEASPSAQPYLVDSTGQVFWQDTGHLVQGLPKLLFIDRRAPGMGQFISGDAGQAALKFFSRYQTIDAPSEFPAVEILVVPASGPLTAKLAGGTMVFLPVEDAYVTFVDSLRLILNKYRIEGKHLKKVDLRFKNPVVEY